MHVSSMVKCLMIPIILVTADVSTAADPFLQQTSAGKVPIFPWPGGARSDLTVPDSLWQLALSRLGRGDRPLGYTSDEMANYGRDALILRPVKNLFRDLRTIHRFSGKAAEDMIVSAANPADMTLRAFALTDVSAGRNLPMPDSASWGVDWVPKDATPMAALDAVLAYKPKAAAGRIAQADRRAWEELPESTRRLVIRIVIGAAEAIPWIQKSYDDPVFTSLLAPDIVRSGAPTPGGPIRTGATLDTAATTARYRFAMAPWIDGRMDQSATLSRASLEALARIDRDYLAFGSVVFITHLQRAIREFQTAEARNQVTGRALSPAFPGCNFETAVGPVRIYGPGVDPIDEPAFLTLDLGGDDRYLGRHGVPLSPEQPIGIVLDLSGSDTYEGGPEPVSLGCGLFGLGAVFDLAGDDHYRCAEAGLGAGYFGTGLLVDYGGNDAYILDTHDGQGSAVAGVGLLIDLAGDDSYTCGYSAQGFGETLGAGILVDVKGNDAYLARDDGNPSALYNNQSVSMAQGVGQGRRADLGDGHSLAGGIGFLVDGAGDDSYHASAWSQGAGYWWAAGFLEDLGGNDRYRNGKYSLGAGAHFAIGCQVDLAGDDKYNVGNDTAVNQYQGHARDGSIGISIDGDGDDQYYFRSHCGGSGDLDAIALFWDRKGDDVYKVRYELLGPANGWSDTPPMGTATVYTPFRSFRDDVDAIGLFLDTGGQDTYQWEEPAAPQSENAQPAGSRFGNDRQWPSHRGPRSWGLGLDAVVFPAERGK